MNSSNIPYAVLSKTSVRTKGTDYYIRFSPNCKKLFEGAKRCYVLKTDGNKYIIVQPIWKYEDEEKPWTHALYEEKTRAGGIRIAVTGKVRNGFLPSWAFDGKHLKIKRRKSNGAIYICLEEPIEEDEP